MAEPVWIKAGPWPPPPPGALWLPDPPPQPETPMPGFWGILMMHNLDEPAP